MTKRNRWADRGIIPLRHPPGWHEVRLFEAHRGPDARLLFDPNQGLYATETLLTSPSAPVESRADDHRTALRSLAWVGGVLLLGWLALWNELRIDWTVNDQYAYGWFVPPLAAALLALRWRDRPDPVPPAAGSALARGLAALVLICLALLLPLRLLEEPNGDWRLLAWTHASALVALSLAAATWGGGRRWTWHFAFPFLFLLLAVRWPSEPERALVQGLQRWVAGLSAGGMNLLGIPAEQQGNLIRVRDQMVGVNEACSGIRSLQTVLMASLFLGELSRLTWRRRVALLVGGIAVAMAANVFRSSLLVWLAANRGAESLEKYHDTAGVSVLVIVFVGLLILNHWLEPKAATAPRNADAPMPEAARSARAWQAVPMAWTLGALAWLALVEAGTAGWYGWHERGNIAQPVWTVKLPEDAPGFRELPVNDVTRSLLRYDVGRTAKWKAVGDQGPEAATDCTLFFLRWEPGRVTTTLAAMHQPTTCLPAQGLTQLADGGVTPVAVPGGFTLPVHAYEFQLHEQRLYVYYVVWQDQRGYDVPVTDDQSRRHRFETVLRGQRNLGQQTLELILTGPPSTEAAAVVCRAQLEAIVRKK